MGRSSPAKVRCRKDLKPDFFAVPGPICYISIRYMKRIFHLLAIFLLLRGFAGAQDPSTNTLAISSLDEYVETGMEVTGVRAPYYDDDGKLRARLYGGKARILEGGRANVTDIRIDVFEDGVEIMTVYAPQCITQVEEKGKKKILAVESDGDVLIEMEQMTIIGRGFRFSSDSNRFEILSEAKVLVKDSERNMKELTL